MEGAKKAGFGLTVLLRDQLNKRLENVAWGLFLNMLGGFSLVPDEVIPKGLWSIGIGLIMLGLNLARYLKRSK